MRDPARIDPIVSQLRDFWAAHPDLRLGQLIAWIGGDNLFQIEDDELTERLTDLARTSTFVHPSHVHRPHRK